MFFVHEYHTKCYLVLQRGRSSASLLLILLRGLLEMLESDDAADHLIPPARDTSVYTRLRLTPSLPRPNTQFTHRKVLFIHKLWPTPLPTDTVTPTPNRLYTSLPAPTYIYIYAHCLFRLLFLSIMQLHIICYPALGLQGCY